jgi:hypothetical protein
MRKDIECIEVSYFAFLTILVLSWESSASNEESRAKSALRNVSIWSILI